MLDTTLVVVTGEFGRTPRINKNAGRDHWGPAFTVALGGGGIKGGRVVGKTDARAEKPADDPYGPEDLAATLYHCLGIDPEEEFYTPEGRPVKIVNNGRRHPGAAVNGIHRRERGERGEDKRKGRQHVSSPTVGRPLEILSFFFSLRSLCSLR